MTPTELPPITDSLAPPHVLVLGAAHAVALIEKGYKITWLEANPDALKAARRTMMSLPFALQNRIEGIYLLDRERFPPEHFDAHAGFV